MSPRPSPAPPPAAAPPPPVSPPVAPSILSGRVLVVDDEEDIRDTMALFLQMRLQQGVDVETAPDGPQAIAAMARRPADVVVADFRMPAMDGMALLNAVRARWPQCVRIMVTGQDDAALVLRAVNEAHVHGFLHKPVDPDALASQVAGALLIAGQAHLRDRMAEFQDAVVRDVLGLVGHAPKPDPIV